MVAASVLRAPRRTTAAMRAAGAPRWESLEQRARRLALALSDAERAAPWPAADLEPNWAELAQQ